MTEGKRLLVLGGSIASLDVVQTAISMGIYTLVTDDQPTGVAKEASDESAMISTTDMEGLLQLIEKKNIDGVFCGPSEFNIVNTMKLCALAQLPYYATQVQWEVCSNKERFKQLCRDNNVPCVAEFKMNDEEIAFPVIVKPVDGCSSKGISVCYSAEELKKGYENALQFSASGNIIVEKYIENGGVITSVRYIAHDGELYLSLVGDTYVVDPINKTALISAVTLFPSQYTATYIDTIDANVKEMFKTIDFKNGVLFMQSLPDNGTIYFHEMGLRLSGGLTYRITDSCNGVNDLKMMIRYALGEAMCTREEIERIDPYLNGKLAASLCIPLKPGTIGSIEGLDDILDTLQIEDFTQYYTIGDCITADKMGTLLQHFGRFKFLGNSKSEIVAMIEKIQQMLEVCDTEGNPMIYMDFDTKRLS